MTKSWSVSLLSALLGIAWCLPLLAVPAPIPVIIDSDMGDNIDDSWAVALALSDPRYDVQLIVTAAHDTVKRAQIVCKFLQTVNRTDIPVGIGIAQDGFIGPLYGWAAGYDLAQYPGVVYEDGVGSIYELLSSNDPHTYTLMALAPFGNFPQLVALYPDAAGLLKGVVSVSGSISQCYDGQNGACPEYNVQDDVPAAAEVYALNGWHETVQIAPLDVTQYVQINGTLWQALIAGNTSANGMLNTLLDNFCYWANADNSWWKGGCESGSSVLFAATALCVLTSPSAFAMQTLRLNVSDEGLTQVVEDPNVPQKSVAVAWTKNGLQDCEDYIVSTLLGKSKNWHELARSLDEAKVLTRPNDAPAQGASEPGVSPDWTPLEDSSSSTATADPAEESDDKWRTAVLVVGILVAATAAVLAFIAFRNARPGEFMRGNRSRGFAHVPTEDTSPPPIKSSRTRGGISGGQVRRVPSLGSADRDRDRSDVETATGAQMEELQSRSGNDYSEPLNPVETVDSQPIDVDLEDNDKST